MKQSIFFIILTAIVLFLITSCAPKPTKKVPIEFETGQKYFHRVCANCHGVDALGKKTKAPGLIDLEYLPENFSDEEFYQQIVEGSKKMPSQRNKVSDPEIKEIIKYLRYSQNIADLVLEDDDPEDDDEE
jgi:mono/diheme cytochrome c family protein